MTRTCTVCVVTKDLDDFPKEKNAKLGHRNQCRECRKAYHRANSKLYYQKNKVEKIAKVLAYEAANIVAVRQKQKRWRNSPTGRANEKARNAKRRKLPDYKRRHAFLVRNYYARKEQAVGYCSPDSLKARWDYYGHKCWICREAARETDHVKPLTKGGTNWPANLRPICRSCNARKHNNWPYIATNSL